MARPDRDRARGALWGQAIGDALGTTTEFSRPARARPFPELNLGPQTDIEGGGPFRLEPGQITDDTQMAVCLAESLAERGCYDPEDAARRYVDWAAVAFDIGRQTQDALSLVQRGTPAERAGYESWIASRQQAAANGSLMRASPLPVFFAADVEALRRAALAAPAIDLLGSSGGTHDAD